MMRAMILNSPASIESSPLQLKFMPKPLPRPGEVSIRVRCCAICRTDLHVIEGELPQRKTPIIPGHQIVGVVDSLGSRCKRFRVGERVGVAWLRSVCGACRFCKAGKENLCVNSEYTGYTANGGYAEYTTIREDFAYPIPDIFDDVTASPLLCSGIIGFRSLQRSDLPTGGGTLGIFGFGSAAHVVIQLALSRGARVFAITRDIKHQKFALELGATWAGSRAQDLPEKLDSAILFAPAGELVPDALSALEKGGTLAVGGIHLSPVPTLDYERHLFYEKNLRSVTANTRQDGIDLFTAAAEIPIRTHVKSYTLEAANEALQDLKADRISGTGVLVCGR